MAEKRKERIPNPGHLVEWDEHLSEEEMERIRNMDEEDDDFWMPDLEERTKGGTH